MNFKVLIAFLVILAIIIALPFLATMAGGSGNSQSPSAAAPPSPAASSPAFTPSPATQRKPPAPQRPQPAAKQAPRPSNQKLLENTVWQVQHPDAGQVQVQLKPGGRAVANGNYQGMPVTIEGNWRATGNKLNVNGTIPFVNQPFSISCDIKGNQIYHQGRPIKRLR